MVKILFKLLRYSGLPIIFRELIQKKRVTILLFHDISKNNAEHTFNYLISKYNIIHLNDFICASETKDYSKIPPKALIITFDDGSKRNYELMEIITHLNIPITIFLCAGIINTNRHYWWLESKHNLDLSNKSNMERLNMLSKMGFEQEKEFNARQALNKDEINEMRKRVNFQSHTIFHPCLPKCIYNEAKFEIGTSKDILQNEFGLNINAISYPNGDYSDRDINISKESGYKCGITVDFGFNNVNTDIYRLKRLSVNDTENLDELIVKASGVWPFLKTINGIKQKHSWTKKVEK